MGLACGRPAARAIAITHWTATALSIALCVAIVVCSAQALWAFRVAMDAHPTPWWVPRFGPLVDQTTPMIICVVAFGVLVCTVALLVVRTTAAKKRVDYGPSWRTMRWDCAERVTGLLLPVVSALAALSALTYPQIKARRDAESISMQTWTCAWSPEDNSNHEARETPTSFGTLCVKNRLAYWAFLPVVAFQLLLLCLAFPAGHKTPLPAQRASDASSRDPQEWFGKENVGWVENVELGHELRKGECPPDPAWI